MRADLIDRQAAIDAMCELMHHWFGGDPKDEIREIKRELEGLPSAQPEIIHIQCVDCRWWKKEFGWSGAEYMVCALSTINRPIRNYYDFCSRAERRTE